MELRGRRVVVVGLGRSGVAAARLCRDRGALVTGTDTRDFDALGADARTLGVPIAAGGHDALALEEAEVVVVSPGVPAFPELEAAAARGAEIIGELELASRFVRAPLVAVGGTNGKSTTTTLLAAIFEATGRRVFAGGNLGTPLAEAVDREYDVMVVEVSSFQLERAPTFRPRASVLLNVTEDHLDRYRDLAEYAAAKGNAFANQLPEDAAIVPAGDAVCREQAARGRGRLVTFGVAGADYAVRDGAVVEVVTGARVSLEGADLVGTHNLTNAAAAVATARTFGLETGVIEAGLRRFRPLGHRMAFVAEIDGVRYYDDSKGTNVGASVTALLGLSEERAVLIAGGRDKLGSYEPLVEALLRKGRAVVAIGEAADRILEAVAGRVPAERAGSMDEAVERARALAQPGDAVLLSPACSSFDWFSGYAERGDRFVAAVRRVQAGRGS